MAAHGHLPNRPERDHDASSHLLPQGAWGDVGEKSCVPFFLPPGTLNSVLKQAGLKNQRQQKKEGES